MGEIMYHAKNNTKPGDENFSEKQENMIQAARGLSDFFTQIDKRNRKLFPKMVPSVFYTRAVTKEVAAFAQKRLGFHVTRDVSLGTYMMAPTDTVRQRFEELKPRIERIEQHSNKKVIAQPVKK